MNGISGTHSSFNFEPNKPLISLVSRIQNMLNHLLNDYTCIKLLINNNSTQEITQEMYTHQLSDYIQGNITEILAIIQEIQMYVY